MLASHPRFQVGTRVHNRFDSEKREFVVRGACPCGKPGCDRVRVAPSMDTPDDMLQSDWLWLPIEAVVIDQGGA